MNNAYYFDGQNVYSINQPNITYQTQMVPDQNIATYANYIPTNLSFTAQISNQNQSISGSVPMMQNVHQQGGVFDATYSALGSKPGLGDSEYNRKGVINSYHLKIWLQSNLHNPYPSRMQKKALALMSNLSASQVNHWFIRNRKKLNLSRKRLDLIDDTKAKNAIECRIDQNKRDVHSTIPTESGSQVEKLPTNQVSSLHFSPLNNVV